MKVFVSSVVGHYRAAARKAVTLLGLTPVMCEDFGARPDSSQHACMSEVEQADVVVVILGADFGYQTVSGESVTQKEFRRARAAGKPILAFLERVPMEERQKAFACEVSDYLEGLFRATFSDDYELSDGIVRALNQLTVNRRAISESEFIERLISRSGNERWESWSHEAYFEIAFLPQPESLGTLRVAHAQHESFFLKVCQAGLGSLKGGYTDFESVDQTGIDTAEVKWRHHESGLAWLSIPLNKHHNSRNVLDSYFLSPSKFKQWAQAGFDLLSDGKGGWFQIGLYNLGQKLFAEPPATPITSISIPFRSEHKIEERTLLIPASPSAYRRWLEEVMFRVDRKISI